LADTVLNHKGRADYSEWVKVVKVDPNLRELMSNTLISCYPENSVTFVNNRDTQPGQSLESWVDVHLIPQKLYS